MGAGVLLRPVLCWGDASLTKLVWWCWPRQGPDCPYSWLLLHRLAPMRLYTLSKRHFVLVFVVFFICFGLTVFVGIEGKFVRQSFFLLLPYIA